MKLALGGFVLPVGPAEAVILPAFVCEGLSGPDAGKRGFNFRIDVPDFLLDLLGDRRHTPALCGNHQGEDRNQDGNHQGQLPLYGEHNRQGAQDGDAGGHGVFRTVVGQFRQVEQVGGQSAHQLSGAVPVIEIKSQVLHMGEQIPANVRFYPDAEGVAPVTDDIVERTAQDICRHHAGHHKEEGAVSAIGEPLVHGSPGY